MGYESVREMERFLLEGQEQALELTTQGISSLLGNRSDLFDPGVGVPEVIGRTSRPLPTEIEQSLSIDAPASGWVSAIGELTNFMKIQYLLQTVYDLKVDLNNYPYFSKLLL
jgi:hypothetical protein